MKTDQKTIKYHFVGDGSQVISDAPSEDITTETWDALPRHIQKSIEASPLYEKAKPGTKQEPPDSEPEPTKAAAKPDEPVLVAVVGPAEPKRRAEASMADKKDEKGREDSRK